MITELGKALDPVADKLTLGAMILCLAFRYENMRWLVGLFDIERGLHGNHGAFAVTLPGQKAGWGKMVWEGLYCVFLCGDVCAVFLPAAALIPGKCPDCVLRRAHGCDLGAVCAGVCEDVERKRTGLLKIFKLFDKIFICKFYMQKSG